MVDLQDSSNETGAINATNNTDNIEAASASNLLAHEVSTAPGTQRLLPAGTLLQNRFEILRVIGSGGMSTVYLGRDRKFAAVQRYCAIKEMSATSSDSDTRRLTLANFEREANLMAGLEHPAIPKIWDYFIQGYSAFLVIEYIRGKDLEAVMEETNGPLAEMDVLNWAVQILDVLAYLHSQKPVPIVFRDLKPSNLILTTDGRIVLIDFGIAKVLQPDKRGTMVGTEGYSPPEQYRGSAEPRSDLYALAASMHHMLTRCDPRYEVPFTFNERPLRSLNPACSVSLEAVITRALDYDINKRYTSAQEMREALLTLVEPEQIQATTTLPATGTLTALPTAPVTGTMPIAPQTGAMPATGSFAPAPATKTGAIPTRGMGTGALTGGLRLPGSSSGQTSQIPAFATSAMDPAAMANRLAWKFMCEEWVTSSPALGEGMVYVGCYDNNLYAIDQKTGMFKWKYATEGGIASSPLYLNGVVYVGSEDNNLYAINARTGRPIWMYSAAGPVRSSPRASNSTVYVGADDQIIHAVDMRTGISIWKFNTWKPVRSSPYYSNGIIYCGSEDDQLYAIDSISGIIRWRQSLRSPVTSSPVVDNNMVYVGSMDYNVYALDANTGWQMWRYRTENYVLSSPFVVGGRLYIGSTDGSLYCLDSRNGRLIWRFLAGGPITNSSPRVANGCVIFGCQDRHIYCLEAGTGSLQWKYPTNGAIPSSAAIGENMIYIGSTDQHLYALKLG